MAFGFNEMKFVKVLFNGRNRYVAGCRRVFL